MGSCPPAYVAAPSVVAYRYGLFSVAQMPVPAGDRWECGVQYEPASCAAGGVWSDGWCPPGPAPDDVVSADGGSADPALTPEFAVSYLPYPDTFTVVVSVSSAPNGTDSLDFGDGAQAVSVVAGEDYSHTYADAGSFTLTAADTPGGATNISTAAVEVPWAVGPEAKQVPEGVPLVTGDPFVAYAGYRCALPGRSLEDAAGRARSALEMSEQRQVENAYWTGALGNDTRLAGPDTVTVAGAGGSPVSLADGVAALESHLGSTYGGAGVLHAGRGVATYAAGAQLVTRDGPALSTILGTRWVFGGGYPGTGPDGAAPAEGSAWIYATGEVVVRRSEVFTTPPEPAAGFDKSSNELLLMAERVYVVTHECVTAAALVSLP